MKLSLLYITILIILTTLVSCGKSSDSSSEHYTFVDSLNMEEKFGISSIAKIDNNFIIFDLYGKSINVIADKGKVLDSYNQFGKGPGEIGSAIRFCNYGDEIFITDMGNLKIIKLKYDSENENLVYINEFKTGVYAIDAAYTDDKILICTYNNFAKFVLFDCEGNILREYTELAKQIPGMDDKILMSSSGTVSANGNTICYSQGYEDDNYLQFFLLDPETNLVWLNTVSLDCDFHYSFVTSYGNKFYYLKYNEDNEAELVAYNLKGELDSITSIKSVDAKFAKGILLLNDRGFWCSGVFRENDGALYRFELTGIN